MAAVMRWAQSKKEKVCSRCKKTIKPGTPYLNVPKNYRSASGDYCEKCEHQRLLWASHLVEMEDKGRKRPKITQAQKEHAKSVYKAHPEYFEGVR